MTVEEIIQKRGIKEVLHFTTNKGLVGILYSKTLLSRKRIQEEQQLVYIFTPNAAFRKDKPWLDYANLSISEINNQFFRVSSGRWHRGRGLWWCITAFCPIVMTHKGVFFTTTNNMYSGVERNKGPEGLEAMFAKTIIQWEGKKIVRPDGKPRHLPTCEQAEVLYPKGVLTRFLERIYVVRDEDMDDVRGQLAGLSHPEIEVVVDPKQFGRSIG